MTYPISCKDIPSNTEFYSEVLLLIEEATKYLKSFVWCKKIKDCFLYTNIGRAFCIFLFEIENTQSSEDNFLWVIVGDIPSMYLDTQGPKTTKEVIELYIGLAEDWIENVRKYKAVDNCYPFDAEPTIEMAELLQRKISFMGGTLLDNVENIAIKRQ
jgi:hypothetical protein